MNRAGVARWLGVAVLALLNLGCSRSSDVAIDGDFQRSLQARLIDAKPGEVIEIPAGRYTLDRSLSLRVSGVTIRGAGMNDTPRRSR